MCRRSSSLGPERSLRRTGRVSSSPSPCNPVDIEPPPRQSRRRASRENHAPATPVATGPGSVNACTRGGALVGADLTATREEGRDGGANPGAEVGPSDAALGGQVVWRAYFRRSSTSLLPQAWRLRESQAPFCGSGGYRFKPGWSPNLVKSSGPLRNSEGRIEGTTIRRQRFFRADTAEASLGPYEGPPVAQPVGALCTGPGRLLRHIRSPLESLASQGNPGLVFVDARQRVVLIAERVLNVTEVVRCLVEPVSA